MNLTRNWKRTAKRPRRIRTLKAECSSQREAAAMRRSQVAYWTQMGKWKTISTLRRTRSIGVAKSLPLTHSLCTARWSRRRRNTWTTAMTRKLDCGRVTIAALWAMLFLLRMSISKKTMMSEHQINQKIPDYELLIILIETHIYFLIIFI